jgi:hypothetical protein
MGEQVVMAKNAAVPRPSILEACKDFERAPLQNPPPSLGGLRELGDVYDRSFILPLVNGCRKLLAGGEAAGRVDVLENIVKEISSLGITEHAFILAWLNFQVSRLRNFGAGHADFQNLYRWLRICYNTADSRWASYFVSYKMSRDEEMRQVVFDGGGRIRGFFREREMPGRVYLPKLATWFLGRYDLDAAFAILDTLSGEHEDDDLSPNTTGGTGRELQSPSPFHFSLRRLGWKTPAFVLAAVLFLWFGAAGKFTRTPLPDDWWGAIQKVSAWYVPVISSPKVQTWIVLPYTIFPLLVIIYAALWFRRGSFNQARKLLPRLFGGVLVGYIPLISSADLWRWLLTLPTLPAVLIWLLSLTISYMYLFMEARNVLDDGRVTIEIRREVWIRSTQVFLVGLTETYLVGLLLGELIGYAAMSGAVSGLPDGVTYSVINNWGTLVPKVILLYAPVALFLGILVQLIWEEKTVTQPL